MSDSFKNGWNIYSQISGIGYASTSGEIYINNVEKSINEFSEEMYNTVSKHGNLGVEQCKGFVAESWHANTFNINAVLNDSNHRAYMDESTSLGSVDISTNFGKNYSSKYLGSSEKTIKAQSKNYYENYAEYLRKPRKGSPLSLDEYLEKNGLKNDPKFLLNSVYEGQYRLVPGDQLEDTIKILKKLSKIEEMKDGPNRALVYKSYLETLGKITDRISDGEAVESLSLTNDEAKVIVELCREGKFKPEDFGIEMSEMITNDFIFRQAIKSGYTAATISLVIEIAPKIYEAINLLINSKQIDKSELKELGFSAIKGGSIGFIRGYVSCALTIACQSGKLGKQFTNISSDTIAAITVLTLNTIKNSYLVYMGKMSIRELSEKTEDAAIVTIAGLVGGKIGIALLPQLAVIGYMIGSFVGGLLGGFVAEAKNTLIMSLCVNTGITLFGLVEQDYTLPDEIINALGINNIEFNSINENINEEHINQINEINENINEVHSIKLFSVRRGVIGIRKIGFQIME